MHTLTVMESCGYVLSVEVHAPEDMGNALYTVLSVLSSPATTTVDENGDVEVVVAQHKVCGIH